MVAPRPGYLLAALAVVCFLSFALPASAIQHDVSIYLDLDDDATTGCEVPTVAGLFAGAEQVLVTTVATSSPPEAAQATALAYRLCADEDLDTFGPLVPLTAPYAPPWPVGIDTGESGRDVVETYLPLADLVVQHSPRIRLGVVVTDELGGERALLTEDGTPPGPPIVLVLGSPIEIPTLSEWGTLVLVLLLAALACRFLSRRESVALLTILVLVTTSGVVWAAGSLDGLVDDWTAADLLGAGDGIVFFGNVTDELLCFRVDVDLLFSGPPTITSDGGGSSAALSAEENQTSVTDVQSTDPDGDIEGAGLTYGLTGGTDEAHFSIDPGTGVLTFGAAPDFETPTDANADNVYEVQVTVTDSGGLTDGQDLQVTVTDASEPPTISAIADQVTDEDVATGALAFTIADPDTPVGSLLVTASSSNQGIIPDGNLVLGGVAPNLTIDVLPAANQNGGPVTITLTVDDGTTATPEAFGVTVNPVNDLPVGVADSFDFVGNTLLQVDLPASGDPEILATTTSATGVLDNDSDPVESSPISVSGLRDGTSDCADVTAPFTDCPTAGGGRVTMEASGQFRYLPLPGDTAASDSFQYRLFDGTDDVLVTVTLTRFGRIVYVDNTAAGLDNGTSTDPFDTLAEGEAASLAGDTLFVHEGDGTSSGQDAGIRLKPNQRLIGEGVDLTLDVAVNGAGAPTLVFDSLANNRPLVENAAANSDGVTVLADAVDHQGIEIRGLDLAGTRNAIDATSAGFAVTLTVADNRVSGSGAEAIDLNPDSIGLFDASLESNVFATAGIVGNAIDLVTTAATGGVKVAIDGNSDIASTGGDGIHLDGSAGGQLAIVGFADNSVHGDTAGAGIRIVGALFDADNLDSDFDAVAGGITTVGTPGNPVDGAGVVLGTPASAQTRVAGNLAFARLDVASAAGGGLVVAGLGPFVAGPPDSGLQLAAAGGTVIATGGPALSLDPLTANMTLDQILSTGSPTTGVSLVAVDGALIVGDGGTGSSIAASSGTAFDVDGGTAAITYQGVIDNASGLDVEIRNRPMAAGDITFTGALGSIGPTTGDGIRVHDNQSGHLTFGGAVDIDAPNASCVELVNNAGMTIDFDGGLDLANEVGIGFLAFNGGTINVTDPSVNSVATTGQGTPVWLQNVAVGTDGATFDAITSIGSGSHGVFIATVTGGAFSGGDLTVSGNTGIAADGSGVFYASSSAPVRFDSITVDDALLEAVRIQDNTGSFEVTGQTLLGTNSGNPGGDIFISGGTGGVTFAGVDIDDRREQGVFVAGTNQTISFGPTTIDNALMEPEEAVMITMTTGGTVTFQSLAIGGTNPAVRPVRIVGGNVAAIDIQAGSIVSGSVADTAFEVDGGGAPITMIGTITNALGRSVDVRNRTGGTVLFDGAIDDDGAGIFLDSNGAGTVRFRGGLDLDTGADAAFTATGGGTVEVCATSDCAAGTPVVNTISTTTATALEVSNSAIGANGLTFRSISSGGGTDPGIVLDTTGAAGGLTVTGNGGDCQNDPAQCSGGSILGKTGDTDGIRLTSTTNVHLSHMDVSDNSRNGILGTGVDGFRLEQCRFTGNADAASPDEAGIHFVDSTGSSLGGAQETRFDQLLVSNSHEHNVILRNSVGTLAELAITDSIFTNDGASGQAGSNVLIDASGTADVTVTATGSQFDGNTTPGSLTAFGLVGNAAGTASLTLNASASSFASNDTALSASAADSATVVFDVSNNPAVSGSRSHAVDVFAAAGHTGTISARIENNVIGTGGAPSSGSQIGAGVRIANEGSGTVTALVAGNTIQEVGDGVGNGLQGISVQESVNGGTTSVTITGNTLDQIRDDRGIDVEQLLGGGTLCADVAGNTLTNVASATPLRVSQAGGTHNVRQLDPAGPADPARLDTANGGVGVNVTGTVVFDAGPCPQP